MRQERITMPLTESQMRQLVAGAGPQISEGVRFELEKALNGERAAPTAEELSLLWVPPA